MSVVKFIRKGKEGVLSVYNCLPPFVRHMGTQYSKIHDFYSRAQWWSKEKIETWQLDRLKMVLNYAYHNTDGYRQLYDEAKVNPNMLQSLQDIALFPLTSKELLRDNIDAFTVPFSLTKLHKTMTGGSTGLPFSFYADKKNAVAEYAFMHCAWESIGWKETDRGIKLRGAHLGDYEHIIKQDGYHHFALSASFMTEDNYERYMQTIEQTRASYLHVYPSTITDLAHLIVSHGDEGRLNIKHIFLGSENLYTWQEEIIRKAFPEAKLMSWYGHSERAIWAPWCEIEERYHLNPFYGYNEIINGKKPVEEGEVGELVGTSFWMFGTPFIRYRTNDFAEKGPEGCDSCGRHFQLLNKVDGRLSEIIVSKTGRRISLTVFAGSIMHGRTFEQITQFRFIQHEAGKVILAIIPTSSFSKEDEIYLEKSVHDFLGDDFEFEITKVENLSKTKSGKFTYLEQHLPIDRADNICY